MARSTCSVSSNSVLTRSELSAVVQRFRGIQRRRGRFCQDPGVSTWTAFIVFRLLTCCGLRSRELVGLNVGDLIDLDGERPVLRVRKEITKGQEGKRRTRMVPLWWDTGTLEDLKRWRAIRIAQVTKLYEDGTREIWDRRMDAGPHKFPPVRRLFTGDPDQEPLVCTTSPAGGRGGKNYGVGCRFSTRHIRQRWKTVLRPVVAPERLSMLAPHAGRRSFCTHALYNGRNILEVRDAAGHASIATTSEYLHLLEDESQKEDLFGWAEPAVGGKRRKTLSAANRSMTTILVDQYIASKAGAWAERHGIPADEAIPEMVRYCIALERKAKTPVREVVDELARLKWEKKHGRKKKRKRGPYKKKNPATNPKGSAAGPARSRETNPETSL